MPEITDDSEIELRDEDIKMDVYRSSGAGGQKVNKTSSAVRLTHIPTGIVVSSQVERSHFQNLENCKNMLRAQAWPRSRSASTSRRSATSRACR